MGWDLNNGPTVQSGVCQMSLCTRQTYPVKLSDTYLDGDIHAVQPKDIPTEASDVIMGEFPCPGF